jgi:aryl-alcohol dehydrogenase-like predicted oxidoreductase
VNVMKSEPLDFIGVNYAVDDREVEKTILPLARERKFAVLAYAPFGRTRLFRRVEGQPFPLGRLSWTQRPGLSSF